MSAERLPTDALWDRGKDEPVDFTGLGEFLHHMLGGTEPPPGPPYTHTLTPFPQPWYSRMGKMVYRPPVPRAYTLRVGAED